METSLVIKHSPRELAMHANAFLFILNLDLWWDVWSAKTSSDLSGTLICYAVPFLLFLLYEQQQYLAVGENGITYRKRWLMRRVSWRDAASPAR